MSAPLHESLAAVAGKTAWNNGLRAFQEGAVLDVRHNGKVVEARVANSDGRFERVQIRMKKNMLQAKCSCPWKVTAFCEHAVASLLHYAQNDGRSVAVLDTMAAEEDETASHAAAAAAAAASASGTPASESRSKPPKVVAASPARTPAKAQSLRSLLSQVGPAGHVEVHLKGGPPDLDSRWSRAEVRVDLVFENHKFSASNMKRLVEVGTAAGGMRLYDFALQEQQVMRFLLAQAEIVGTRFILGAHDVADLFHCLTNVPHVFCENSRLNIHTEPAELVLVAGRQNSHFNITPRFQLTNHGLLPPGDLKTVVGRGGSWIGVGADYWWLPGIAETNWLRCLILGEATQFTAEDMGRLTKACDDRRLPAQLMPDHQTVELHATTGQCVPVLTLDWAALGIVGQLEFEYAGKRIDAEGPDIIWGKKRFVCRDRKAEDDAVARLRELGFSKYAGRKNSYALREPERLWAVLQDGFKDLDESWQIYYSSRFTRNRSGSGPLTMKVRSAADHRSWFEVDCELGTESGEMLKINEVIEAIRDKQNFVRLASGALATIPAGLRRSLEIILGRAEKVDGNLIRFDKYAAIPVSLATQDYLEANGAAWQQVRQHLANPVPFEQLQIPERITGLLRDYQKDGAAWICMLEECGFHGILADEMGLGKTIQALAILARRKHARLNGGAPKPSLVVCPTSLVDNWQLEAARFAPELKTVTIHGASRKSTLARLHKVDLAITSYALLRRDIDKYTAQEFDYLILDEAQHIKNPETVNAKTCKAVQAEHRLILTGTPVENAMHEVWSLFDFLLPGMLGNRKQFRDEYEIPASNGAARETAAELAAQIRPFILRRTKKEVCKQLPPKIEQVIYCEIQGKQRQLYNDLLAAGHELLRRARDEGFKHTRFEILGLLMRLRQACCHPPLLPVQLRPDRADRLPSAKMELLQEIILQTIDSERRMLLFSQFTGVLKAVVPWLNEQKIPFEYLDGSTKNRQEKVDRFNQDSSIPVFLISLKAGGTGLNLTGADTVIHFDQWWNPMVEDQATDRTHRIGQTNSVISMKLVARNTIEEKILTLQAEKRELFNDLIGGAPTKISDITPEDFEFLLAPTSP